MPRISQLTLIWQKSTNKSCILLFGQSTEDQSSLASGVCQTANKGGHPASAVHLSAKCEADTIAAQSCGLKARVFDQRLRLGRVRILFHQIWVHKCGTAMAGLTSPSRIAKCKLHAQPFVLPSTNSFCASIHPFALQGTDAFSDPQGTCLIGLDLA